MELQKITVLLILTSFLLISAEEKTPEELAKMSQNPLANMISFPLQDNMTFGIGDSDRVSNALNIQPVLPFLNGHIILRTIIPIITLPTTADNAVTGVGDINVTAFLSPTPKNGLTWGAGPVVNIPTGTDVSSKELALGASFLILKMTKKVVFGGLVNNVWAATGGTDPIKVNSFLAQYFVNVNFPKGWYLSTGPIITADWTKDSDNQWTVPFGGGGGKIIKIGKIPVNLQAQLFGHPIRPDGAGNMSARFQIQLLFPKGK
jgi:hypothetical protein